MMPDDSPPPVPRLYYFIAALFIVAASWWLWRPLGMIVAILLTGKCRGFVVRNAPFWRTGAVLAVGVTWGCIMALGITAASGAATTSVVVRVLLQLEGFFAVGYVGYSPAPVDRMMYNTAGQTARAGMVCYVLTCVLLAISSRWIH